MLDSGTRFIGEVCATYAVTFVVVSSTLFAKIRTWVMKRFPLPHDPHPIACRMCFSFWAAFLVCLMAEEIDNLLPVYGAAYFLATQER